MMKRNFWRMFQNYDNFVYTECLSWFNTSKVILQDQGKLFTKKVTVNILSEVFMKPTNIFFIQIIDIYQTIFETIFKISCHEKSNQALF